MREKMHGAENSGFGIFKRIIKKPSETKVFLHKRGESGKSFALKWGMDWIAGTETNAEFMIQAMHGLMRHCARRAASEKRCAAGRARH